MIWKILRVNRDREDDSRSPPRVVEWAKRSTRPLKALLGVSDMAVVQVGSRK